MARNVTMEECGVLAPGHYLIHDRDGKYCPAFQQMIDTAGVKRVPLPPRSPHLNAHAERWVRSVKDEALSRMMLFGEAALYRVLNKYMAHYHHERNHQGKGNMLLFPAVSQATAHAGPIRCREPSAPPPRRICGGRRLWPSIPALLARVLYQTADTSTDRGLPRTV